MINIIAAIGKNREIGMSGQLPWRLKSDLQHFKNLTSGNIVIMGRKTFDSIGRPLPNRVNIVVTRGKNFRQDGITTADSIESALKLSQNFPGKEIFIIGGGQIYQQTLSLADKLYITEVDFSDSKADAFFPKIDNQVWQESFREKFESDQDNQYDFSFVEYSRK
jgi:dihydrofolate reductase